MSSALTMLGWRSWHMSSTCRNVSQELSQICRPATGRTSRKERCSAWSVSECIFLTATIAPLSVVQHSTTPDMPLPTSLRGRRSSGRMKVCCSLA